MALQNVTERGVGSCEVDKNSHRACVFGAGALVWVTVADLRIGISIVKNDSFASRKKIQYVRKVLYECLRTV